MSLPSKKKKVEIYQSVFDFIIRLWQTTVFAEHEVLNISMQVRLEIGIAMSAVYNCSTSDKKNDV